MRKTIPGSQETAKSNKVSDTPAEDVWIPTLCWGCTKGTCAVKVRRVNGVAVDIQGNENSPNASITQGRICSKSYLMLEKLYSPYRIKGPMKRTNPIKGPGIDPKWVEISWDEALDIVAKKLKEIRGSKEKLLACTYFAVWHDSMAGTYHPFVDAFGPHQPFKAGHSLKCGMAYHSLANCLHGAFRVWPDYEYCNYFLVLGSNVAASCGVTANMLQENAVRRGMKVVVVDPVLNLTAAKADEWLPIRPATDGAFLLALIHVIVHELNRYDEGFLKEMTNAPYLVGPDGYWMRDKTTGKVMVWDVTEQKPKVYDAPDVKDAALRGNYTVQGVECRPSFEVLKEHVSQYTPEWASAITDIPADTIRRVAREWVDNAQIGATINIDGVTYPYRPVAVLVGRGVETGSHSYQNLVAHHILALLVGALEVPGGTGGGWVDQSALEVGVRPGEDGMLLLDSRPFTWPPDRYDALHTLFPFQTWWPVSVSHFSYLMLTKPPPNLPVPPAPEVYIRDRDNPITGIGDPIVTEVIKGVPFVVDIACYPDEVTELADVVLPDHTDLERYDVVNVTDHHTFTTKYRGVYLRQPVVEPVHNTMDIADISTELADRAGFLDEYNMMTNIIFQIADPYKLKPGTKYAWTDIVERKVRSDTGGEYGLDDFKEQNIRVIQQNSYGVHLKVKELKMRYYLPYMEKVKRVGDELHQKLTGLGIDWWPTEEYTALPTYFPSVLDKVAPEYDLYAVTHRLAQCTQGVSVTSPWVVEALKQLPGEGEVMMHTQAAQARGIKDGEEVWIASETGKIKTRVKLCEGIRPDTILFPGQLSTNATPISRGTGWASLSPLTPAKLDWTCPVTGTMQGIAIKVKVYKGKG